MAKGKWDLLVTNGSLMICFYKSACTNVCNYINIWVDMSMHAFIQFSDSAKVFAQKPWKIK